jgi:hypothetical protein
MAAIESDTALDDHSRELIVSFLRGFSTAASLIDEPAERGRHYHRTHHEPGRCQAARRDQLRNGRGDTTGGGQGEGPEPSHAPSSDQF